MATRGSAVPDWGEPHDSDQSLAPAIPVEHWLVQLLEARSPKTGLLLWLMAAVLMLPPAEPMAATLREPWSLVKATEQSQLIFLGTVSDVAFRDSDGDGETMLTAPHTFVTYRIEEVLRGTYLEDEITLRFTGGFSPATGRIMVFPNAPLFATGDRDLLLVRGNETYFCPLAGCGLGRFRIVDEEVFDNRGLAIRLTPEGGLRLGPDALDRRRIVMTVPPAPEARLIELRERMSTDSALVEDERAELRARLQAMSAPRTIGITRTGASAPVPAPAEPPAGLAEFLALLRDLAAEAPAVPAPVASTAPDQPFTVRAPVAQRAAFSGRPADPHPLTLEQQLLRRNGGNPVLVEPADDGR